MSSCASTSTAASPARAMSSSTIVRSGVCGTRVASNVSDVRCSSRRMMRSPPSRPPPPPTACTCCIVARAIDSMVSASPRNSAPSMSSMSRSPTASAASSVRAAARRERALATALPAAVLVPVPLSSITAELEDASGGNRATPGCSGVTSTLHDRSNSRGWSSPLIARAIVVGVSPDSRPECSPIPNDGANSEARASSSPGAAP